jgi:hypothetical protein
MRQLVKIKSFITLWTYVQAQGRMSAVTLQPYIWSRDRTFAPRFSERTLFSPLIFLTSNP